MEATKKMKKILALMLSCVMVIAFSVSALATNGGSNGDIPPAPGSQSAWAAFWQEYAKAINDRNAAQTAASAAKSEAEAARNDAAAARSEAASASEAAAEANSKADAANAELSKAMDSLDAATQALSKAAEDYKEATNKNQDLQKQVNNYAALASKQSADIAKLSKQAGDYESKLKMAANDARNMAGRGSSSGNTTRNQMMINNNAVSYGGNVVAQGGHVEINGGKSNVTFIVGVPDGGTMTSAASLAANVKGSLINCVTVTSTVAFRNARVNFYVSGVTAADNIAVYQLQNGKWVQLPTPEIRQDHVIVNMTRYGTLAFIRVPVLASVSY
ncbi:hypothetical protein bpr_I2392 [Butyrivibrio proteoclasticus B316]|uniref:Cell surface protein n=2 Tax=Butyrivibrio proteoclasticus TaxID=43305 RepID=E0RZK9_BUTPB|nr:hypothetical protein bpr_I2392 [Butyrivibrio proteoclasticus B316]